jgi:hypothetical protein
LANDILNVVHGIRERIELLLKVDLKEVQFPTPCDYIPDDDEDDDNDNDKEDYDACADTNMKLATAIMLETSGRALERIRVLDGGKNVTKLPSTHAIYKQLPIKVECVKHVINKCNHTEEDKQAAKTMTDNLLGLLPKKEVKTEEDALRMFSAAEQGDEFIGAKLAGPFNHHIDLMVEKHNKLEQQLEDGDDLILLNSFDGAEAFKSSKQVSSVISFSSSLYSPKQIQTKQVTAGSSTNILTWQQVLAKEELATTSLCLETWLQDRKGIVQGTTTPSKLPNSKVWCYDIHDVKMLYLLTQHSLWNRKNHPFLMCGCNRTGGLNGDEEDNQHSCHMYSDDEYLSFFERSKKRWSSKRSRAGPTEYSITNHKDWCDQNNSGVTHFGVCPTCLPLSTIRFDTFHMKCAITRRMMNCLRTFIQKQSSQVMKAFTDEVLRKIWKNFHIYCWNNSLNFSKFQGSELRAFVEGQKWVLAFLKENFEETSELTSLYKGLSLLGDLFKFLGLTYTTDAYLNQLEVFKNNLKTFFKEGKYTYLKDGDIPAYFHIFRFYIPQIAEETYERHKLGLGIFTMQGFERRNKESKKVLNKASTLNRKSPALLVNNVKRLELLFLNN